MNSRGSVFDLVYIVVIILVLGISILLSAALYGSFINNPSYVAAAAATGDSRVASIPATAIGALEMFNTLIVGVYILLNISMVLAGYLVRSHPAFFVLNVIVMVLVIVIAALAGNMYYEFASHSAIAPYTVNYPIMTLLFTYLPILSLFFSCILAVAMYGKPAEVQYGYTY